MPATVLTMRTVQLPRRRQHAIVLCAMILALLTIASGCLHSSYEWTGDDAGVTFSASPYSTTDPAGMSIGTDIAIEAIEILAQPVAFLIDFITLRWLWDHSGSLFSGLGAMILRLVAILPGYAHIDLGVLGLLLSLR